MKGWIGLLTQLVSQTAPNFTRLLRPHHPFQNRAAVPDSMLRSYHICGFPNSSHRARGSSGVSVTGGGHTLCGVPQ